MKTELEASKMNNTWNISDFPPKHKPIACKWVYRMKYQPDGSNEQYKARLIVKAYTIYYHETFVPWPSLLYDVFLL